MIRTICSLKKELFLFRQPTFFTKISAKMLEVKNLVNKAEHHHREIRLPQAPH
jgi:hypothetical protein